MPIDPEAKRCGAIGCRRLPWFRRLLPSPDGTVTRSDRQRDAMVYPGIVASGVVVAPAPKVSTTLLMNCDHGVALPFTEVNLGLDFRVGRSYDLNYD